jgi:hypothetical protein
MSFCTNARAAAMTMVMPPMMAMKLAVLPSWAMDNPL